VRAGNAANKQLANNFEIATEIATERHFTPQEIAALWGVSPNTVRRQFREESGVIEFGSDETRWSRKRKVMRIPSSVLSRVHERLRCKH
jgi:DeoR-like helix-turn-helix domain